MSEAAVYILHCADGSYYVGSTKGQNVHHRLDQHNRGFGGGYTSRRRPVQLVWTETFARYDDAFAVERQLNGWSRAKKAALIRGDWGQVQALARNRSCRVSKAPSAGLG